MGPDGGGRGRRRRRSGRRRTAPRGVEAKPRDARPSGAEGPARRAAAEPGSEELSSRAAGPAGPDAAPDSRGATEQRGQRGRGRGRRGGRGRGAGAPRGSEDVGQRARKEPAPTDTTTSAGPGSDRSRASRPRSEEQVVAKRMEPESLRSRARDLTAELLDHMGIGAVVSAAVEDGGGIAVQIDASEEGAVLIGRRGTTLDALEHVINRMTTGADPGARVRVTLDVCGYRERRKAILTDVATRLKQHALSTRRRVQITPLSPHDRIVFQDALAGDDEVTTRIVGSGFYRRILVIPRGQENEGAVVEEFNEEGQAVAYPGSPGSENGATDESPDAAFSEAQSTPSAEVDEVGDELPLTTSKSREDDV